jgi:hypothetical protein
MSLSTKLITAVMAAVQMTGAPMSYIPEVKGVGEERWTGNGLRFATADEALAYANDLQSRWMGCKGGLEHRRAAPSSDPVSHAWRNGRLVRIEETAQ